MSLCIGCSLAMKMSPAGFGAMARHMSRLRMGLEEALSLDLLDQDSLQLLQPKSPAINMTAAMQFSMGTRTGKRHSAIPLSPLTGFKFVSREHADAREVRLLISLACITSCTQSFVSTSN